MSVLIIAEHDDQQLKPSTLNAITAAKIIKQPIDVLVAGFQCDAVVDALKNTADVKTVLLCKDEAFKHPVAESLTELILTLAQSYDYFLAPATTFGKNVLPRVAAKLDVQMISDVIEILPDHTYRRPIYAGNAIAKVKSLDAKQVLSVRATAFSAAEKTDRTAEVNTVNYSPAGKIQATFVKAQLHKSERPELTAADMVISGGRGLKDRSTFEKLTKIAERLGAAMGASRAAVDAELAPNDYQVGQTGQIVAPKLYIAVGISGAVQHLAGMKDSKLIVAINKDPDAPIFQIADYGLVADINDVLPQWEQWLTDHGY